MFYHIYHPGTTVPGDMGLELEPFPHELQGEYQHTFTLVEVIRPIGDRDNEPTAKYVSDNGREVVLEGRGRHRWELQLSEDDPLVKS